MMRRALRLAPWLLLLLAPILASWPAFVGFSADPIYPTTGLMVGGQGGWLPGFQNLDLNIGATTQALGHLAAEQWLRGEVPWWNPFNGIGMPLAGEMQASALFLPYVLLLHFQNGPLLLKLAIQMTAGLSCHALLRALGMRPLAALLGALMFAISGSFAWLGHAPIMPIAFLPLFLLGIERARTGGFRLIAVALALSLTAGFPETAYIDGLLALFWAIGRLAGAPDRRHFAGRVALGGALGLMLAAPALWSFAHMLLNSASENHALQAFDPMVLPLSPPGSLPAVWLFPYIYGALYAFSLPPALAGALIGTSGGYFGPLLLLLALLGLWGRRYRALRWTMFGWIVLCIGGVYGLPVVAHALYALPMMRQTIVPRYFVAAVTMAAIVLAMLAFEDWRRGELPRRALPVSVGVAVLLGLACLAFAAPVMRMIGAGHPRYWLWPIASIDWAGALIGGATWMLARSPTRRHVGGLVALLAIDAAAMFALPMLAGPRHPVLDHAAVDFLHDRVGLQRFYSLGPYRPNYGAFFETAQLNHEYLPIPANWVEHIHTALDPSASAVMFRGNAPDLPPGQPSHAEQLVRNLAQFEALGVRYVVTPSGSNPFAPGFTTPESTEHGSAHALRNGDALGGVVDGALVTSGVVDAMGVAIGTYMGQSDGQLAAELCAASGCAHGTLDLAGAGDNAVAMVPLTPSLMLRQGDSLRWRFTHLGGKSPVAIWLPPGDNPSPPIAFTRPPGPAAPPRVYHDGVMDVYELPGAAPYFETRGGPCALAIQDRTNVQSRCDGPATLIRRELFFPGWRAEFGGNFTAISPFDGVMQQISLPAGVSRIRFSYAPPYAGLCWAIAAFAALVLLRFRRGGGFAGQPRSD
jgi:hypothetical protein